METGAPKAATTPFPGIRRRSPPPLHLLRLWRQRQRTLQEEIEKLIIYFLVPFAFIRNYSLYLKIFKLQSQRLLSIESFEFLILANLCICSNFPELIFRLFMV